VAPQYDSTTALLNEVLDSDETTLVGLNLRFLKAVCDLLEVRFDYSILSEMDLVIETVEAPGDWALRISEILGARQYLNPPGGAKLYDAAKFREIGVELIIHEFDGFEYDPGPFEYESTLSIVDVLMWNPVEQIREHLADTKLRFEKAHPL
jgi:hypothetical protein